MEYKDCDPFEPPAREPDPGSVLEQKNLKKDFPKRYCTEMHRRMLSLLCTGSLLAVFAIHGDYTILLVLAVLIILVGIACAVAGSSASKCPHCNESITIRGSSADCPKCKEWIPYDEFARKPGPTNRQSTRGNDPLVHGGK